MDCICCVKCFDFDPLYIFSHKNSNSCLSLSGEEGEVRSVLQEQSTALGLSMFALLVQRCTELLKDTAAGTHTVTSTSSRSAQVWISSMYQSCGNTLRFMYFEIKVNISIKVFASISNELLKDTNISCPTEHQCRLFKELPNKQCSWTCSQFWLCSISYSSF